MLIIGRLVNIILYPKVKKLLYYTKPASLQKYAMQTLDSYSRDIKRAEIVKQIIKE